MKPVFYIQADPRFDDSLRVREYFEFVGGGQRVDVNGSLVPAIDNRGHVDDDIRAQHPKEYAKFAALVEAHQESAYAVAKANPGKPIYPVDFVPAVEPEPSEVEA